MRSTDNTLLILVAFLLLGGGGYVLYTGTRGLRNNNPGNIRYDGTAWEGLANPPQDDKGFCVFVDPSYGIRAMARILSNYVNADGVASSVAGIISRWAPPSENDTAAYIRDVAGQLGVDPNVTFDLSSALVPLVAAIVSHENAVNPYSNDLIAQGVALA